MYRDTYGLCPTCYKTVPARLSLMRSGAYLTKICPQHGEHTELIDPDIRVYDGKFGRYWAKAIESTALNVTDRCNLKCTLCYHNVRNSQDKPIDYIVELAARAKSQHIILMGAEPTMREDLSELIDQIKRQLGKSVFIYTNGLKLDDPDYLSELTDSGLDGVFLSLHSKRMNTDKTWDRKMTALSNMEWARTTMNHLAFSMGSVEETEEVILQALKLRRLVRHHFRVRLPGCAGRYIKQGLFLSDLINKTKEVAEKHGLSWEPQKYGNSAYIKMVKIDGVFFWLTKFPTVATLDLKQISLTQKAIYVPQIEESNLIHQVAIQDGIWNGSIKPAEVIDWGEYDFRVEPWPA